MKMSKRLANHHTILKSVSESDGKTNVKCINLPKIVESNPVKVG